MSSSSSSKKAQGEAIHLEGLPGSDLVRLGIEDLLARRTTVASCLAVVALPKLQGFGLVPPNFSPCFGQGELTLYRILCKEGGDAYSRYNALLRELVSFEQALSARLRKAKAGPLHQ